MLILILVLVGILLVFGCLYGRAIRRAIQDERRRISEYRNIQKFDSSNE